MAASAEQLIADYYPLIAKAVTGLRHAGSPRAVPNAGGTLCLPSCERSIRPSVNRSLWTSGLLFEEAMRRIESEAAHRTAEYRTPAHRHALPA